MKNVLLLLAFFSLLIIPLVSYAETAQECASNCVESCSGRGTIKDDDHYKNCLTNCLKACYDKPSGVPEVSPPTPVKPSPSKSESSLNINIIIAAADVKSVCAHAEKLSGDSCCQNTQGENKGYCPEGYAVFKDVRSDTCKNGSCFKYGDDCMKAGFGFCYYCSICVDNSSNNSGQRRR